MFTESGKKCSGIKNVDKSAIACYRIQRRWFMLQVHSLNVSDSDSHSLLYPCRIKINIKSIISGGNSLALHLHRRRANRSSVRLISCSSSSTGSRLASHTSTTIDQRFPITTCRRTWPPSPYALLEIAQLLLRQSVFFLLQGQALALQLRLARQAVNEVLHRVQFLLLCSVR